MFYGLIGNVYSTEINNAHLVCSRMRAMLSLLHQGKSEPSDVHLATDHRDDYVLTRARQRGPAAVPAHFSNE